MCCFRSIGVLNWFSRGVSTFDPARHGRCLPMDGLAHSLAVASCGLEATEIAELSAMYDLYAVKRTDHVITEAEARGLWRLLGV